MVNGQNGVVAANILRVSKDVLGRSPELERFGFDSTLNFQKLCCPATTVPPRPQHLPGISSGTPKPTVAVAEKGKVNGTNGTKVKETKEVRRRSLVMEDLGARGCHGGISSFSSAISAKIFQGFLAIGQNPQQKH